MEKPLVSIIIPNYNELSNIKRGVLKEVDDHLTKADFSYEVIIVDDGSTDNSPELITESIKSLKNFKFIRLSHAGKPFAIKGGVENSIGRFVLFTDMDQSTPITELNKLLEHIKDYDVIIGSRGRGRDSSWYRQIISIGFWFFRRSIILPDIVDTQCGFKLLKKSTAMKIFQKMQIFNRQQNVRGWKVTAYDVEMLFLAKKMGNQIKEVRVRWRDEDTSKDKDRNFVKESIDMLKEIVRVRINDMRGLYA